jgi:hypothetical protein
MKTMPEEITENVEIAEDLLPILQFKAAYEIGTALPGAPNFHIDITVSRLTRTLTGTGKITQAVFPPVNVDTRLQGTYMPLGGLPAADSKYIVVTATGTPIIRLLPINLLLPLLPNVHLFMILDANWRGGSASYRYKGPKGQWIEILNVPVKRVS